MVARSHLAPSTIACLVGLSLSCGGPRLAPTPPAVVARAASSTAVAPADPVGARVDDTTEARSIPLALQIGHGATVYDAAFSPDGTLVATGDASGVVEVWSPTTGEVHAAFDAHDANVTSLAFSRDGARLSTGGEDGRVVVLDLATAKRVSSTKLPDRKVWGVGFDASGGRLVVRDDTVSTVRDVVSGAALGDASSGSGRVILSRDGASALSLEGNGATVSTLATGRASARVQDVFGRPRDGVFSPDGKELALAFSDAKAVVVYDAATGARRRRYTTSSATTSVAWGGDVVAAVVERGVDLFDAGPTFDPKSGNVRAHVDAPRTSEWFFGLSDDGARLFAGVSGEEIGAFDAKSGQLVSSFRPHKAIRRFVVDGARGRVAVLYEKATDVDVWDGTRVVATLPGAPENVRHASLGVDGRSLVVVEEGDPTVRIFDLATGRVSASLPTSLDHVYETILSPSGKRLFATGYGEAASLGLPGGGVDARFAGTSWSSQFEGAFDAHDRLTFVGEDGYSIHIEGKRRILRARDLPTSLAFGADGTLAAVGREGVDLYEGASLERHFPIEVGDAAYGLVWTDRSKLLIASERALYRVDTATGKSETIADGAFVSVAVSSDGSIIAAGERGGRVSLFDGSGQRRAESLTTPSTPWSLAIMNGARPVLVVAGGRLLLVRIDDGKRVRLRRLRVGENDVGLAIASNAIAGDPAALAKVRARKTIDVRAELVAVPPEVVRPGVALDLGR